MSLEGRLCFGSIWFVVLPKTKNIKRISEFGKLSTLISSISIYISGSMKRTEGFVNWPKMIYRFLKS